MIFSESRSVIGRLFFVYLSKSCNKVLFLNVLLSNRFYHLENTITAPEVDIIEQCIAGNSKAQYELYRRYASAMLNVAYRILKNEEEAKDVLQDSFIKIFKELKNLKNKQGLAAWIKRIVVNTTINHAKKKGVKLVELNYQEPKSEEKSDAFENMDLEINRIKSALMQLPDGYRTVLTLYLIDGYDHEEISQILNISKSTSLTQYSRGKKRLKELLK